MSTPETPVCPGCHRCDRVEPVCIAPTGGMPNAFPATADLERWFCSRCWDILSVLPVREAGREEVSKG